MHTRKLTEKSPLINEDNSTDEVRINFNDSENDLMDHIYINFDLQHFLLERKNFLGQTMPGEVVYYIMDFLTNRELANLSEVSKEFNSKVKETIRGKEILKFIELQPSFPSACFTYFSTPEGIRQYLPYTFSFTTAALGAAVGFAIPSYALSSGHMNIVSLVGGLVGGTIGAFVGSFLGTGFSTEHCCFAANQLSSIAGSTLGGAIMTTVLDSRDAYDSFFIGGLIGIGGGIVGSLVGCLGAPLGMFAHRKNHEYLQNQLTERDQLKQELKKTDFRASPK